MKVSQLIMQLLKVDADLDVFLQADAPKDEDADGVIDPVDVVEVVSITFDNGDKKKMMVTLKADSEE